MFEAGAHVGIDIGVDGQITAFLQAVRDRLLWYATEAWISHSPCVVTGLEEELHCRAAALAPATSPAAGACLSPAPQLDAFALLSKYMQRVKVGTMTVTKFDVHKLCILATGPSLLPASPVLSVALVPSSSVVLSPLTLGAAAPPLPALPLLSMVPPPSSLAPLLSQASAPSPAASGASVLSPLLFSSAPPILVPSEGVSMPSLSQRPVHQAAVLAAMALMVRCRPSLAFSLLMSSVFSRSPLHQIVDSASSALAWTS